MSSTEDRKESDVGRDVHSDVLLDLIVGLRLGDANDVERRTNERSVVEAEEEAAKESALAHLRAMRRDRGLRTG